VYIDVLVDDGYIHIPCVVLVKTCDESAFYVLEYKSQHLFDVTRIPSSNPYSIMNHQSLHTDLLFIPKTGQLYLLCSRSHIL